MAVFLARIVMPRSFSSALLSMTRSTTALRASKGAGLAQQLVDQRGLAMVDVGDDGDVAKVLDHGRPGGKKGRGV